MGLSSLEELEGLKISQMIFVVYVLIANEKLNLRKSVESSVKESEIFL